MIYLEKIEADKVLEIRGLGAIDYEGEFVGYMTVNHDDWRQEVHPFFKHKVWVLTDEGIQKWIDRGLLKTKDDATRYYEVHSIRNKEVQLTQLKAKIKYLNQLVDQIID